jgi:hypothetical protein
MVYSLWDVQGASVVDAFTSEDAALEEVRATVHELGREAARSWALVATQPDGQMNVVAEGEALIDRAFGAAAA